MIKITLIFSDEESLNLQCLMGKAKYFQVCNAISSALDKINVAVVHFPTFLPALIEKMKLQLAAQDWEQAMDTSQRFVYSFIIHD